MLTAIQRFMRLHSRVSSGCWEWTSEKTKKGYGRFRIDGKNIKAHRFAYSHFIGEIPEGMMVCHHCDNPGCVNPDHLFIGTAMDNIHDMILKGRHPFQKKLRYGKPRGNKGYFRKKKKFYMDVCFMFNQGIPRKILADYFGVGYLRICEIIREYNYAKET